MPDLATLQPFLAQLSRCTTFSALSHLSIDTARAVFGTSIAAFSLFDETAAPVETHLDGLMAHHRDDYEAHWRSRDPVLAAVLRRGLPTHRSQVMSFEAWRRQPFFLHYSRRLDVAPYMAAPLYSRTGLAGILSLCRRRHLPEFGQRDLELATILCGCLSASLASLPREARAEPLPLSARERQIALLTASGLSNPDIASQLGLARETVKQTLRRAYNKLDVRGRVELSTLLVKKGWL